MMLYKFSIDLMSGDCDGHGSAVIFSSSRNCFTTRAVCFGSLSFWKIKSSLILLRAKGNIVFLSMSMYWKRSIIPLIRHIGPGPLREKHAHTITFPLPSLRVFKTLCVFKLSLIRRLTYHILSEEMRLNYDSSENNTFCQSSLVQCLWALANASRLFRFLELSSGFFWAFRPLKLKSSNLLLTVPALICVFAVYLRSNIICTTKTILFAQSMNAAIHFRHCFPWSSVFRLIAIHACL